MQTSWKIRLLIALFSLGVALYFVYPSFVYFSLDDAELKEVRKNKDAFSHYLPSFMSPRHIVPGLDLQGGSHIVLGVDLDKAIADKTSRALDRLVETAKKENLGITSVRLFADNAALSDRAELTLSSAANVASFKEKISKEFYDFQFVSANDNVLTLRLNPDLVHSIRQDAVHQTITTIMNRIDSMGVAEPSIAKRGEDQVQIQLPGHDDPEQAKALLGRTAQLRFQMCADNATFLKSLTDLPAGVELIDHDYSRADSGTSKDMYLQFNESQLASVKAYLATRTPPEYAVKFGKLGGGRSDQMMRSYTLERKVALTGDDLVDARVSTGGEMDRRPGVSLTFGPAGAKIFAELTAASIGKRMAIVLEDTVDSAPVINSKIPDGNAFISMGGARTQQEMMHDANQLSLVLKSGALPAPVTFREERTVGPSLGKQSVEQVKVAFAVGAIIIVLFMIYYYRFAGLTSIIAVLFNLVFVLAAMSFLGATITLPGIAAMLLTIGVAVDANVIINERIREELRLGKTPRSAVKAGYQMAMNAILDANITTFIAGMVLWQFGTGSVQNFATMLMIGTVSSVITSIFVSRIFIDMVTSRGQKTLSI